MEQNFLNEAYNKTEESVFTLLALATQISQSYETMKILLIQISQYYL